MSEGVQSGRVLGAVLPRRSLTSRQERFIAGEVYCTALSR